MRAITEFINDFYIRQIIDGLSYGDKYKSQLFWQHKPFTKLTNIVVIKSVTGTEMIIDLVKIDNNPHWVVKKLGRYIEVYTG